MSVCKCVWCRLACSLVTQTHDRERFLLCVDTSALLLFLRRQKATGQTKTKTSTWTVNNNQIPLTCRFISYWLLAESRNCCSALATYSQICISLSLYVVSVVCWNWCENIKQIWWASMGFSNKKAEIILSEANVIVEFQSYSVLNNNRWLSVCHVFSTGHIS